MAEIQLKENWAGYPPGAMVSVSDERAKYLVTELKVARYTPEQKAKEAAQQKAKEAAQQKAKEAAQQKAKKLLKMKDELVSLEAKKKPSDADKDRISELKRLMEG